ncbi:1,4-alpha-glucan branching protein GlgB [Anaerobium acetethylicum]|uniref:1,4-alpha-glucan branching enzyme GlgB n=1 Tax=Anaerobium acetethylicum TaxID=1619234 RepID=A0A1D3TPA8_9FIRM|nr:1,4-alpha-glucan branching protein GlgB [Anaerobium acetethylicum]SCP95170.1 1,4-alpha-glucan branching enzyme [Anaerobium acetethylicum]
MDDKLYELMNWAEIEAVVYSEEENPHSILGPHITENGVLIQAYMPTAVSISVNLIKTSKSYAMELVDEGGFFAVLIPRKTIPEYTLTIEYDNGEIREIKDPYAFQPLITEKDTKRFNAGIHYSIYEHLGAHKAVINGTEGIYFAVWAPSAMRVSVVGNFNLWDGRVHQMRRLWDSGVFEIFIPDLNVGEVYKFELKLKSGLVILKADPYANAAELRPNTASVVTDIDGYNWNDSSWIEKRKKTDSGSAPMAIYEVHLGSWKRPEDGREFYNYRELAPMLAEYVKEMGYTHVELMPIMEYPYDASWGYQVTGYFAPTSRYGTPEDFMYFMDYMHQQEIGIILDWVPAHFPRDTFALSNFDGTCLYEHRDPRQGAHPHWGTLIYNYGRPEVSNFLIANALFWVEKYHADGIRMDAVASMLYLDYGKNDGEWVANIYGGNENLEAVEFLKHLNSIFKKRKDGALLIAEESTAWPMVTADVEEDGLGFDYKWNMGWMNDFIGYMQYDPFFRSYHYGELIFSMIYAYSEKFILVLSHDEVVHGKGSMIGKMPGDREEKFSNLRLAYGYMMAHPGKKLLFMGQDIAQFSEWSEEKSVEWDLLKYTDHINMKEYVKALNKLYKTEPALYSMDYDAEGFEWINNISANENIVVFARKTENQEDTLLIVCNFTPLSYSDYLVGVPYRGKYKEIFNSDSADFGGTGFVNPRLKQSKKKECDDRDHSITIKVPPLGISVFKFSKIAEKASDNKALKTKAKDADKKPAGKKPNLKEQLAAQVAKAEAENEEFMSTHSVLIDPVAEKQVPEAAKKETVKKTSVGKSTAKKPAAKKATAKKDK